MNSNEMKQEERKSILMHEVMDLIGKRYKYDEIKNMVDQVKEYEKNGSFEVVDELPEEANIDILINHISAHEKSAELAWVLGIFVAYNADGKIYLKHFEEEDTEDIIRKISNIEEDEEEVCNIILDVLGFEKAMEIIESADVYIGQFTRLEIIADTIKDKMFQRFAKLY